MACPICEKRSAKRYCPAKGAAICAVCCGTEREVTISCPSDCPHLIAARRYDEEHRKPLAPEEVPYPDVRFSSDLVHEHRPVISGLGFTVLKFVAEEPSLDDSDVMAAVGALAETYRTLGSGIYYEKPPDGPLRHALYAKLAEFLQQCKEKDAQQASFTRLKDGEIFFLLVFLLRVGRSQTSGRPKSRAFLDFLRAQFPPLPELQREEPRIIAP